MDNNSIHIKALKLVEKLNDDATENVEFDAQDFIYYPFEFLSDGNTSIIKFMSMTVFDSEMDSLYDELDNEIHLEEYVKNKVKKAVKEFNAIKV